jgi:transcriptional regulator with XRE-family HTH domain
MSYIFNIMNTKSIGDFIRRRRRSLNIDQRSLSQVSGVAVHTLSNIEAGKGNPTVETLTRVLDAMGMELTIRVKE